MTQAIPDSINLGTRKCCSYDKKSSPVNKWLQHGTENDQKEKRKEKTNKMESLNIYSLVY